MLSNLASDKILNGPGVQPREGRYRGREACFSATGEGKGGQDVLAKLWNQNGNSKYLLMACLILYTCLLFLWR